MTNKPKKPTKPNTKDTTAPYTFKSGDLVMFDNRVGFESTGVVLFGPTCNGTPPGMVAVWTGEFERDSNGQVKHVLYELPVDRLKLLSPTLDFCTHAGQDHA